MTPFHRFRQYLTPYWPQFVLGVIFILLANAAKLAAPLVLSHAIDELRREVTQAKLWQSGGAIMLIALLQGLFMFLQQRMFIHISRNFEFELRTDFYAHLQKLPLAFYQKYRTGDLMARAMGDLGVVRTLASAGMMYLVNTIFFIILVVPLMISINWSLTLLTFIVMPLVVVATQGFSKSMHKSAGEVQQSAGLIASRAQEALTNIRITRAYTQEAAEVEKFEQINREAVMRNIKLARLTSLYTPTLQLIIEVAALLVLCIGGSLVIRGAMTIGQFVQFVLYVGFLVYPMVQLGSVISLFQRARASMSRIDEVMSASPVLGIVGQKTKPFAIKGEIEFRHLNFTYEGASGPTLRDINLRLAPGQMVAIIGAVGSGKTTLMNLIPRLLEPEPGQLLIDGRPVQEIPLDALRSAIGYVPQESFLFSSSLAANVCFGAEHATPEEIERAASEAELAKDIEDFPNGYETVLGERGIMLSGGQKQRLAIARALVRRPSVLLLDDSLSAVDAYTEDHILKNLKRQMRHCTSLVISHRVSTVKTADLIAVLENGAIVERGTHEELVERGGVYAKLYAQQILEEELVAS
ncbi:MAG TPA: ABC transporter ATP-binding protein [Pyrinomonadaceae bacterium]